ncbi:hypothetical protein B9Z55_024461 [Caenorhabditis nigoni]|uniref:Uncharacterized protein n=1 Tax=Caenorhabditis nigoni TaxID=1611254 RepID=A0A2G5SUW1_9PELO|nr:hypothetical protein B9Z55_024461 [Caenorhabditis nigoni]
MSDHDSGRRTTWLTLRRAVDIQFPTVKFPATVKKNCYKKMAEKAAKRQLALKNKKKNGKGKAQTTNSPSTSTVEKRDDNWFDLTQSAGQVSGTTHNWELEIGGNVFASSYSMLSEEAVLDQSTLHFYYNKKDQTRLKTSENASDSTKEGKFARLDHYFVSLAIYVLITLTHICQPADKGRLMTRFKIEIVGKTTYHCSILLVELYNLQ